MFLIPEDGDSIERTIANSFKSTRVIEWKRSLYEAATVTPNNHSTSNLCLPLTSQTELKCRVLYRMAKEEYALGMSKGLDGLGESKVMCAELFGKLEFPGFFEAQIHCQPTVADIERVYDLGGE